MQNNQSNLTQKNIAENLSRFTTHDTPLTTGNQVPLVSDFTKNTGLRTGIPEMLSDIGTGNLVGGHLPITKENELIGRTLGGEHSLPLQSGLASGLPLSSHTTRTDNLSSGFPEGQYSDQQFSTGTSGFTGGQQYSTGTTGFTGGQQFSSGIPISGGLHQSTSLATEKPIITGDTGFQSGMAQEFPEEQHKKKGLLGKITGLFHHAKAKNEVGDTLPGSQELINQPSGLLDEKGTTVTLPQGTASNSKLGLPVTGPDYTHGTHGITEHTVFTGGYPGPSGGLGQNVATTSMPLGLGTENLGFSQGNMMGSNFGTTGIQQGGFQGGNLMGSNFGTSGFQQSGFQGGNLTGSNLGTTNLAGIDVSGANATHIDRDITLQEGGLLGLRQGAVTGNPGDIITNFVDSNLEGKRPLTQPISQPVFTTGTTTQTLTHETIPPTGLGGDCSLIRPQ